MPAKPDGASADFDLGRSALLRGLGFPVLAESLGFFARGAGSSFQSTGTVVPRGVSGVPDDAGPRFFSESGGVGLVLA
ncbi:MAG: hypothetical protein OEZ19_11085, partial [Paracoccaceae bacterium]|nr:hypothetical protein [Paracoccaceae bacterium]